MSDNAKRRIDAIGKQLDGTPLPPIAKVAASSTGPRVPGKVVIITGPLPTCSLRLLSLRHHSAPD